VPLVNGLCAFGWSGGGEAADIDETLKAGCHSLHVCYESPCCFYVGRKEFTTILCGDESGDMVYDVSAIHGLADSLVVGEIPLHQSRGSVRKHALGLCGGPHQTHDVMILREEGIDQV